MDAGKAFPRTTGGPIHEVRIGGNQAMRGQRAIDMRRPLLPSNVSARCKSGQAGSGINHAVATADLRADSNLASWRDGLLKVRQAKNAARNARRSAARAALK